MQYGNLNLLTVDELNGGMFPNATNLEGIKIYSEGRWKLHDKNIKIFGVSVQVPDVFPILKYPEHQRKRKYIRVKSSSPVGKVDNTGNDPRNIGYLPPTHGNHFVNQQVGLEDINTEFEKLVEKREAQGLPTARNTTSIHDNVDSGQTLQVIGAGLKPQGSIRRARSTDR